MNTTTQHTTKKRWATPIATLAVLGLVVAGFTALPAVSGNLDQAEAATTYEPEAQSMHRLYNRVSHEHLYTADMNEVNVLTKGDWNYEGVGWVAPKTSSKPVYRLYNPILGDHHYTTDANEVKVLTSKHNWRNEGIGWYSDTSSNKVVYRQFNPGLRVGSHNYTTDTNEYQVNNTRNGWKGEGEAWRALAGGWTIQGTQLASVSTSQMFVDVPSSYPFYADIQWLAQKGITTGWSDGTYRPEENISRGAFAAFLYRLAGKPAYSAPSKSPFSDVATSHPFYKEIAWANSRGIVKGWADGTFRPEHAITRDAAAAMVYRYVCSPGDGYESFLSSYKFTDVASTHPFSKEISWMKYTGTLTGWADGTFRPSNNITRGAIAAMIHRLYTNGEINTSGTCTITNTYTPTGGSTPATTTPTTPTETINNNTKNTTKVVTPQEPSVKGNYITLPAIDGVDYYINGIKVQGTGTTYAGDYATWRRLSVSEYPEQYKRFANGSFSIHVYRIDEIRIVAKPKSGYSFSGNQSRTWIWGPFHETTVNFVGFYTDSTCITSISLAGQKTSSRSATNCLGVTAWPAGQRNW